MSTRAKCVGTDGASKLRAVSVSFGETWMPGMPRPEPPRAGAMCACGLAASQFGSRREFNDHRKVCA